MSTTTAAPIPVAAVISDTLREDVEELKERCLYLLDATKHVEGDFWDHVRHQMEKIMQCTNNDEKKLCNIKFYYEIIKYNLATVALHQDFNSSGGIILGDDDRAFLLDMDLRFSTHLYYYIESKKLNDEDLKELANELMGKEYKILPSWKLPIKGALILFEKITSDLMLPSFPICCIEDVVRGCFERIGEDGLTTIQMRSIIAMIVFNLSKIKNFVEEQDKAIEAKDDEFDDDRAQGYLCIGDDDEEEEI